ncbi:MAG TPA: hypothetical protein DEH10_06690 [Pseudomonas sp.]|nr:hypothetical protein [Pseudomonas sp.]
MLIALSRAWFDHYGRPLLGDCPLDVSLEQRCMRAVAYRAIVEVGLLVSFCLGVNTLHNQAMSQ